MKVKKWVPILILVFISIGSIFLSAYLKQRRKDKLKSFISIPKLPEKKPNWVKNEFYGLNFSAPDSIFNLQSEIEEFNLPNVKVGKGSVSVVKDLVYSALYLEIESEEYDLTAGIKGILTNFVSELKGRDLKYNFDIKNDWINYGIADGTFIFESDTVFISGFLSANKIRKVEAIKLRALIIAGSDNSITRNSIDQSINSINLDSLKKDANHLRWRFETGNFDQK